MVDPCRSLEGLGTIHRLNGAVVSRGHYRLTIIEEDVPVGDGDTGAKHASITGYIEALELPGESATALKGDLVLKLEDGRTLLFFFHLLSERRSVGYITARGVFE